MGIPKENSAIGTTDRGAQTLASLGNISLRNSTKSGAEPQAPSVLNRSHFPEKVSSENLGFSAIPIGTRWATVMRFLDGGALHFGDLPCRNEAMQVATLMAALTGGRVEQ